MQVVQIPTQADLDVAADVKDTARIQGQWLIAHPFGRMAPRVPSNAIAYDSATAECPRDLSQKHIEVASQELYAKVSYLLRQSIHECSQCSRPFKFHGSVMPMHSTNDDLFSKMANVLFEANLARHYPRSRLFVFAFLSVVVIIVDFVFEALQEGGVVLASGNQNSRVVLFASNHPVLERASPL